MKCPKHENGRQFVKSMEEELYQQRLDKVLSKFTKENGVYYFDGLNMIEIDYIVERGYRIHPCGIATEGNTLSLDTVEHLIKDIERG